MTPKLSLYNKDKNISMYIDTIESCESFIYKNNYMFWKYFYKKSKKLYRICTKAFLTKDEVRKVNKLFKEYSSYNLSFHINNVLEFLNKRDNNGTNIRKTTL